MARLLGNESKNGCFTRITVMFTAVARRASKVFCLTEVRAGNCGHWSLRGLSSLLVDRGFRQLSQGLVRLLLFLQGFIEKAHSLLQTKLLCPCLQRPISGDLIVLD